MVEIVLKSIYDATEFIIKHTLTIGRDPANEIVIDSEYVSRYHSKIAIKNNECFISDMRSTNGTFVNEQKISSQHVIGDGDIVTIGMPKLAFKVSVRPLEVDSSAAESDGQRETGLYKWYFAAFIFCVVAMASLAGGIGFVRSLRQERNAEEIASSGTPAGKQETLHDIIRMVLVDLGEKEEYIDEGNIARIEKYVEYYDKGSLYAQRMQVRKQYIGVIDEVLFAHDLPEEYSFIAFVESGYQNYAYNKHTGARGMWQLLKSTGRAYGLTITSKKDERTDPRLATEAAAAYISDMAAIFGYESFLLIAASFNCGDGTLRAALKKIKNVRADRSFFYLDKEKLIPAETSDYVCKIIAAIALTRYNESRELL